MIRILLVFIVMNISFLQVADAQGRGGWTSGSRSAVRSQERALNHYQAGNTSKALQEVRKAIRSDSSFIEAYMLLAEISLDQGDESMAIFALEYVVAIDQQFFPQSLFHLGDLYISQGEYTRALAVLNRYTQLPNRRENGVIQAVERSIATCHFALEAMKNPVAFNPVNLGEGVNTELDEYYPSLTVDEQILLFTRLDRAPQTPDGWDENLYLSQYRDYLWQSARNIGSPVNTRYNEGASAISPDGQMIVFTSCEIMRGMGYGAGRSGYGSCDLFYTFRNGESWSPPKNLGRPVNSNLWESQPAFDADGKTLYFVRGIPERGGTIANADIFFTQLNDKGQWSDPIALGPNINTSGNEEGVFIHPDGQTLYFSSDGHPGMGGYDVFLSRRGPDGAWGPSVNLGYPINTARNELGFIVSASGKMAYFSSNRPGGAGGQDIYRFELDPSLRPFPVTYLKGVVYDAVTTKPVAASFELINLNTGKVIISSYSDGGTGEFMLSLPTDQPWMLNVSKENYLFYSDHFELTGRFTALEPFEKDIPLQPVKTGESMVLRNIFFDIDQAVLKSESVTELNKLATLLLQNNRIEIEISGHTDNTGSRERNQILSENRAKAVVEYLIAQGVDSSRLTYKGYADRVPIADNTTEEGRALNRRTEFKILRLK
jgi:outer membrane protein OmpA-like peptidoglycan-associated protein